MIEIEEVNFRFSGLTEEEGSTLGQTIMQQVINKLPNHLSNQQINQLDLKLELPTSVSQSQRAHYISNQIVKKIISINR